jgi:hypothetical protein
MADKVLYFVNEHFFNMNLNNAGDKYNKKMQIDNVTLDIVDESQKFYIDEAERTFSKEKYFETPGEAGQYIQKRMSDELQKYREIIDTIDKEREDIEVEILSTTN